ITGPWTVQFDPQWFYPTNDLSGEQAKGLLVFDKLEDWVLRPEPAVRFFSGTAVYRKVFNFEASSNQNTDHRSLVTDHARHFLDLGTVKATARVRLNGKDLGVVWCPPWRVEITGAAKPGENALEIEVVNLWPNRLVGDGKAKQRRTRTQGFFGGPDYQLSSGLLGPVTIQKAQASQSPSTP
ncbi:MAG: hypothetical protein NT154_38195, partial [Verrucomicrobia bacterium]|nr:hypothetical protein [Verrucomicrobiota bacterium]